MVYRMISSRQVIAKVFADLDIKEGSNKQSDMLEWIGEAVEKIGAVRQLKRIISGVDGEPMVEIKNNQARLPSNLFRLNNVLYSKTGLDPFSKMRLATGSINVWRSDSQNGGVDNSDLKYSIKPGYINTNIDSGYLKLVYDAIPVDEDGFPLIPDNISYTEAIYWYVVMKLKYPEYLSNRIDERRYYDIKRSWNFYCKQAYGEAMMPNMDEMESIKNQWNRLVPELNSHSNYYNDTDEPQIIYNKN